MLLELVFIGIVTVVMPIRALRRYRRKEPPAPPARYVAETLLLTGALSALLWRRNTPLETLGLSLGFSARWALDMAICLAVIIVPDFLMVWRIERQGRRSAALPEPQGLASDAIQGRRAGGSYVTVTVVGAIWEELCFRGAVFTLAPRTLGGVIIGVVVGSLLFGAHHLRNGPSGMIYSTAYGVVFALLFVFTGNLWAVMIAHMAGNLLTVWLWAPRLERARRKSLDQAPMFLG